MLFNFFPKSVISYEDIKKHEDNRIELERQEYKRKWKGNTSKQKESSTEMKDNMLKGVHANFVGTVKGIRTI